MAVDEMHEGAVTKNIGIAMLGRPASPLVLAARVAPNGDGFQDFYNGKIEAPRLSDPAGARHDRP